MFIRRNVKLGVLLAFGIWLIQTAGIAAAPHRAIPETMVIDGTQYVQCALHPEYPFQTAQQLTVLSGPASGETGSRTRPWLGLSVRDRLLFNSHDRTMLYCPAMIGRNLMMKGYSGIGKVKLVDFLTRETRFEIFENAFFVTEINGWAYISGYPVNESTGKAAPDPVRMWIENAHDPVPDSGDYFKQQSNTPEEKE